MSPWRSLRQHAAIESSAGARRASPLRRLKQAWSERAPHGVVNHHAVSERSVIMRAVRAHGEELVPRSRQEHVFVAHAPEDHVTGLDCADGDAVGEDSVETRFRSQSWLIVFLVGVSLCGRQVLAEFLRGAAWTITRRIALNAPTFLQRSGIHASKPNWSSSFVTVTFAAGSSPAITSARRFFDPAGCPSVVSCAA